MCRVFCAECWTLCVPPYIPGDSVVMLTFFSVTRSRCKLERVLTCVKAMPAIDPTGAINVPVR